MPIQLEDPQPAAVVTEAPGAEVAAPAPRALTADRIPTAFGGRIEPVRPSLLYRLWVLIVAVMMVALPVFYVAIIGLVMVAVLLNAAHHAKDLSHINGLIALRAAVLAYVPCLGGAVLVALLLKPLFGRPAPGPKSRALDRDEEPLLFAFVEGVCDAVGAPRPARIEVDCRVNASAHRDGGLLGLWGGELVLTIGLPFVAGVSLQQFAGVLAHEFGHFSQTGLGLYVLITRVNLWFAQVVYRRDRTLEAWSSSGNRPVAAVAMVTRLAIWLTRRVLWVLMRIGHVASGFLSRQMEFDADRHEARMVGADCFAETAWRLRVLAMAEQGAIADLRASWQQRRLPDNFPRLVLANIPQIPAKVLADLRREMETASGGLFSTHPVDRDRIALARREAPGAGICHLDGPATDVFSDFDALSRSASFDLYRASLGGEIGREQLYEVSELVETQAAAQEGAEAAGRFFLRALDMRRRLPMPAEPPADRPADARTIAEARRALEASRPDYVASSRSLRELDERLARAELALVLLGDGVSIRAADHGLPAATVAAAESAREKAEAGLRRIAESDPEHPFAVSAVARLVGALATLEDDRVADAIPDGRGRRDEVRALYRCAAHMAGAVMPELGRLARARSVLIGAIRAYNDAQERGDQPRKDAVLRAAAELRRRLEETRGRVGDAIAYPFEHASEGVTLGRFAFPAAIPAAVDVNGLMEASGEAIDRLAGLHGRALGRLALAAEEVERALGLEPIVIDRAASDGV